MKFFEKCKDGGPQSPVDAYFLVEIKWLFSIAFLKFNKGHREAYHTHAFHALTWFIKGWMIEEKISDRLEYNLYIKSLIPKLTTRYNLHRVKAREDSWCFTIRGPWQKEWKEFNAKTATTTALTHGRRVIKSE
jgi:hypothetical protein